MSERSPLDAGFAVRWLPIAVPTATLLAALYLVRRSLRDAPELADPDALAQLPVLTWIALGAIAVAFAACIWLLARAAKGLAAESAAARALGDALARLLWMGGSGEAKRLCERDGGYFATVFAEGLEQLETGPDEARRAVEERAAAERKRIARSLVAFTAVGAICLGIGVVGGVAVARIAPPKIVLRRVVDDDAKARVARAAAGLQIAACAATGAIASLALFAGVARLRARARQVIDDADRRALAVLLEDRSR